MPVTRKHTPYCVTSLHRQDGITRFLKQTLVDVILDRIVHDSYTFEIQFVDQEHDKSMREVYGNNTK